MLPFTFQVMISKNTRWYINCTLKYKSNILIKKSSGNLFVTIFASARGICTRKCEKILCPGTRGGSRGRGAPGPPPLKLKKKKTIST